MVASALAADDPYGRLALALAPVSSSGGMASALAGDDPYGRLALALAPVSSSGGWYRQWQLMTPMVGWL